MQLADALGVVAGDVDDNQVIAAAAAAHADLVVFGGSQAPAAPGQDIDIVDTAETVRRIAAGA